MSCNEGAQVSVIECDIRANRQDGIDASEAQVTVRGNTIAENGSEGNSEGYGIGLYNGATGTIENNIIRDNFPRDGIFLDESRDARVVNNTIMGNHRDGIYADDASAYIEENDISSNEEDGIDSENSVLEIQACLIRDNGFGEDESAGIYAHGSENSLRVNDSVIVSNSDWAILNKSKTIIDATDNWWGDPTGPFHERDNVFGRGDAVSDLVSFVPFKTRVSGEAPVVAGELLDGVAARGTFSPENRLRYYRLEVPQGKNLLVRFRDADGLGLNHVYLRHGDFPSPGVFDYRHETSAADQQVFVPAATAGTWYILAYQFNSGGSDEYTIEVELRDVVLFGVSPSKQGNEAEMTLSVEGGGFIAGARLELIAGQRMFSAASTEVDSYTQLTASFERASVPPGVYDVQVTVPERGAARLAAAFEVLSGGEPKLVTNLVVPSQVGYHQVATIYVEYANEGEVAMTAPLLVVTAEQNGQRKGLLTLDKSIVNRGFWTSATPSGFSHSVEILGSGEKAGILNAGESKRIPVYYVGWLRPWDPEYPPIGFRLGVISDSNSTPINWGALETRMRPTGIDPAAWSVIYGNFTSQAGSTWGEFVSLLSGNAKYLSRLGEEIRDMDVLLDFEFSQANGMSILPELSTVYDLDNRASRLPLFFKRSFPQGIQARYRLGPLGRGWTHNWEAHLEEDSDGKVRIEMTGRFWTFEPDSRGGFLADLENVSLEKRGSTFLLRFADESSYEFEESRLVRVTDAYDNAIDLEYSVERLARLVHSHGYVVDLGYDAAGRIQQVSDNTNQRADYTYSGNGDLLRQVEYSNGKRSEYSYLGNENASRQYALGEIQFPDGSHQYFEYDSRGRLTEFSRDEEVNRVRLQYDSDGRIVLNEGEADTRSFFVDHRGRMRRLVNAEGSVVNVEYNAMDRIAKITGPDGLTYRHEYDEDGRLVETIDPDGNRSAFFWRDPAVLELYTDKKGVPTRYLRQNDDNGSTLTERRPDGTSVSNAYDSRGLRTQRINARGGVTLFEHDERGRLVRTTAPDESVTEYQYDAGNNIVRAENGQGVISLDYDDYNRLIQMDYPGGKVLQFTYHENGQRASMIDPEGNQVRYSYDEIGRLRQLEAGGGELYVRYDYDLKSRIVGRELGNGMTTEYQYDSMGRVTSLINRDPDGVSVSEFHYRYDPYGRRTEMRTLNGSWTYEYDHLGRLMEADFESVSGSLPNENYRYEYDAMGNRVKTIVSGLETSYEVNTMNQPVQVGGSEWVYDEDGNLRQGSEGGIVWNYSYDSLNRLVGVASGETTLALAYDALGHLSEVTQDGVTRSYLYDPVGLQNIVAEYDSAGEVTAAYVHGHGLVAQLDRNGPSSFFSSDALGATSELSSPSGAILSQYGYGPFGNVRFETEPGLTSFKFLGSLGQRQLASNLIDMRARVYHSGLGQFLSEDPLKFSLDSNRIYADSDPLNRIDPSGLQPKNIVSGVVGVGGGLAGIAVGGTLGPALGFGAIVYGGYKAATGVINYYFPNDDGTYPFSTSIYQDVIGIDKWIDEMWVDAGLQEKPTDYTTADGIALALDQAMGLLPSADTDKIFDIINDVLSADATGEVLGKKLAEILELLNEDEVDWDLVETLLAQSIDPNEKVGPAGYGPMRFIRNDRLLAYRIDFENDEDASAPAQVVQITDALDPDLDWSTFELTEVGFGDFLIPVPPKTQHFEQTQMMSFNGKYFAVEIDIRLDPNTGELRALFSSMDPLVGLPPAVDVGFLPPEDGTGRGMGYLSYLIKPKSDRPTGTDLRNIATIVFDFGEVINTNQVDPHDPTAGTDPEKEAFNTIDADMPVSEVAVLPATVDADRFEVRWSGVDGNGSGVRSYDVYVQEDGGSFSLWLDNVEFNSALFEGQSGHRYGFYSVATDHVGLVETGKRLAEAQTTVTGTVSDESPYDLWGQQHFTVQERTDPLVSGETADPDHDGIMNLVEFALLLDPRNPDREGLPQAGFVVDQDDLFVTLTFRKRQGVSGLSYRIDSSDDLENWRTQVVQEVLLTSDAEKDVVMVLLPVTSDERKFIRLSIELSE